LTEKKYVSISIVPPLLYGVTLAFSEIHS